jgi:predicted amidophosphoribosyltransferase
LRALLAACIELLLPRACARCGSERARPAAFCAGCALAIARLPREGCRLCQTAFVAVSGSRCGACARERAPLAQIAAEAPFDGEVATWVHRFKYPAPASPASIRARPPRSRR